MRELGDESVLDFLLVGDSASASSCGNGLLFPVTSDISMCVFHEAKILHKLVLRQDRGLTNFTFLAGFIKRTVNVCVRSFISSNRLAGYL